MHYNGGSKFIVSGKFLLVLISYALRKEFRCRFLQSENILTVKAQKHKHIVLYNMTIMSLQIDSSSNPSKYLRLILASAKHTAHRIGVFSHANPNSLRTLH